MTSRKKLVVFLVVMLGALFAEPYAIHFFATWRLGLSLPPYWVAIHRDVETVMRDGVRLQADVYLPYGKEQVPTVLIRTPYDKRSTRAPAMADLGKLFAGQGFGVVIQDVRGKNTSGGTFYPHQSERADGADTISWIIKQPWSDRQVGGLGMSYLASTVWLEAVDAPRGVLKTLIPWFGSSHTHDAWYDGDVPFLKQLIFWMTAHANRMESKLTHSEVDAALSKATSWKELDVTLTGRPITAYRDFLDHPTNDRFWDTMSEPAENLSDDIPVLLGVGWYDQFLPATLRDFQALQKAPEGSLKRQSRLIIGPWTHDTATAVADSSADSAFLPQIATMLRWCRHYMLNGPDLNLPPVRYYLMGKNVWKEAQQWPPADLETRAFYLQSDGSISSQPTAETAFSRLQFNPKEPPPVIGGHMIYANGAEGPRDQSPLLNRGDVLWWTSAPLESNLDVVGRPFVDLKLSSTLPGVDLVLKLIDLAPDGTARLVTDGFRRVKSTDWISNTVKVPLLDTAYSFTHGHRLQIALTHSDFPSRDSNALIRGLEVGVIEVQPSLFLPLLKSRD